MTDMTRREAMAAMAAAAVSGVQKQAPLPPGRATLLEVPTKRVLTPADFSFEGYLRFPPDFDDLWWAYGQLAVRRVGDQVRVFSAGDATHFFPVLEYRVPDAAPSAQINSSTPMLTPIRPWDIIPDSVRITGGTGGSVLGGFLWDEARHGLWSTYKDWYAPVEHHPTVLFIHLPDGGPMKIYGPWRTEWNSQMTGGGLAALPQSFVDAHLGGGSNVGVTCYSGGAASPFGASLSRLRLPDPFTTKPDVSVPATVTTYPPWTIANDGLIKHDIDHRQTRDTRYKVCGWNPTSYDCKDGSTLVQGPPLFGGFLANDHDTMSSVLWIDLPDKHGVLFFGQLATTPEGYTAPGDPDGLIHAWYGAALSTQNPMGKERYCCHGQYDEYWNATGPGAHRRVAKGWIYNPNDLAATAQKKADLWSRVPTSDGFEWGKVIPYLNGPVRPGAFGGSAFDAASRRIYVVLAGADTSFPGKPRPLIAVLSVK